MKLILLYFSLLMFLTNCERYSALSLKNNKKNQIIAFQPFNNYDNLVLSNVSKEIGSFYNKQVIILSPLNIPGHFYNSTLEQYNADSLLKLLVNLRNDTIAEVVGITHIPLFTIKEGKPLPYYDENILGIGYQPGCACIISDYKFNTVDRRQLNYRLKKVILHEIGHNLGLAHCENNKCVMSKENGNTIKLDNSDNDYCNKCKDILHR